MQPHLINLYHVPPDQLFDRVREIFPQYAYDAARHSVILQDELQNPIGSIRLPLHLLVGAGLVMQDTPATVFYLSVESGNAALIAMEDTTIVDHTTFSAYMTRKKQGFSQIKYLKKKGKSRAGSRVRLAETVEFFESINTTLSDWMERYLPDRLALNCNKTLLPFLTQCRVAFPFEKKDPRLYKIPLHIPQSNFTNLEMVIRKLRAPVLLFEPASRERLEPFLADLRESSVLFGVDNQEEQAHPGDTP